MASELAPTLQPFERGFQTFESAYVIDDEPERFGVGPRKPLELVDRELRRLSELSEDDLRAACIALWPRCEHNFRHFLGGGAHRALSKAFREQVLARLP